MKTAIELMCELPIAVRYRLRLMIVWIRLSPTLSPFIRHWVVCSVDTNKSTRVVDWSAALGYRAIATTLEGGKCIDDCEFSAREAISLKTGAESGEYLKNGVFLRSLLD